MSYVKGYGGSTDVKFRTLSRKNKIVIDQGGNLFVKNISCSTLGLRGAINAQDIDVHGNLLVEGNNTTLTNDLFIGGNEYLVGNLNVNGIVTFNGPSFDNGDETFNGVCTFNNDSIFNGNTLTNGISTFDGSAIFDGNTFTNGISTFNGDSTFNRNCQINSLLIDSSSGNGLGGQILTATGSGISWETLGGNNNLLYNNGSGYVNGVPNSFVTSGGSVAINATGSGYTALTVQGPSTTDAVFDVLLANQSRALRIGYDGTACFNYNVNLNQALIDYTLSPGTNGQVLTSTGTKIFWKNPGTYVYDRTGALSDSKIYNGACVINGTTGATITLPANYSNSFFKVQLTYNALNINVSNAGILYANVTGQNSFVIYSTNASDTNSVNWMTTGSTVL